MDDKRKTNNLRNNYDKWCFVTKKKYSQSQKTQKAKYNTATTLIQLQHSTFGSI